jgi:hypothetical protein
MKLKKNKLINKNQKSYKESNFKGRKEKKKKQISPTTQHHPKTTHAASR